MGKFDLKEHIEFSQEKYVSKTLFESEKVQVVLFCLEKGQEVPSTTLKSQVIVLGISGQGTLAVGNETYNLKPESVTVCESMATHGLKADNQMVALVYIIPRP